MEKKKEEKGKEKEEKKISCIGRWLCTHYFVFPWFNKGNNNNFIFFCYSYIYSFFLYQWNVKTKKQVYYVSLETEVTKGFLVNLHLLCFYGDLREKKLLREWDMYIKLEKKEHMEILLVFRMLFRQ